MTTKAQIIAINKLLSDIYQRQMRLSYLFAKMDFSEKDIELIAKKLLKETIACFLKTLQETTESFRDGKRLFQILLCVYGLTGNTPQTLQEVGEELSISRERVRQLKEKGIKKLKGANNILIWENSFKENTIKLLKQNFSSNDLATSTAKNNDAPQLQNFQSQTPYQFKIHRGEDNFQYVTIANNLENSSTIGLMIKEENIQEFCDRLIETIDLIGWKYQLGDRKTYDLDCIRKEYQRAYEKWTAAEDKILTEKFQKETNIEEIAKILKRQPSAIFSRLQKLGLK